MEALSNARVNAHFATGSSLCAALAAAIGIIGLAGWAFGLPHLTALTSNVVPIKAITSLCIMFLGSGVVILNLATFPNGQHKIAIVQFAAAALGTLTIVAIIFAMSHDFSGGDAGEKLVLQANNPAQFMSQGTLIATTLFAAALILFSLDMKLASVSGQMLTIAGGITALTMLTAYMIGALISFHQRLFAPMSLHAAIAFLLLALALLATRPMHGLMQEFSYATNSAQLARRTALALAVLIAIFTILRIVGRQFSWLDTDTGKAIHPVAVLVSMLMLLWLFARFANRTELLAQRLHRVQRFLSEINALIVRTHDVEVLFDEACRIANTPGGYPLAWIGLVDSDAMRITPMASAGSSSDIFHQASSHFALPSLENAEPASRSILSAKPVVVSDITTVPEMPFREELSQRGMRSFAMLPLVVAGKARGVLALHTSDAHAFDQEEMQLLEEVAGDIAFALDHIEKEQQLSHLILYDSLTQLANRTLFMDRLAQHMTGAARAQGKLALLLLDIAHFRQVNIGVGRHAGDEVLREIGTRIKRVCEPERLGHLSADQFAMILPRLENEEDAIHLFESIRTQCFDQDYEASGQHLALDILAGIAVFPRDGTEPEALIKSAETALISAKQQGEKFAFNDFNAERIIREQLLLKAELRRAISNNELRLYYQLKVNIRTRTITGVEALMRWQSPERGLVSPGHFIPVMEETRLIIEAGGWALSQASRDALRLTSAGVPGIRIAVNISPVQLRERDFVQDLARATGTESNPSLLELEITESGVMEHFEHALENLQAICDLGFSLSIDDFGTGYSSLARLEKIPASSLKIDRSFVNAMLEHKPAARVVHSIIDLAHSLDIKVIAEGVETEAQAAFLAEAGCDEMQGYLISEPLPYEEFEVLAKRLVG